jgi:hypothetical protein
MNTLGKVCAGLTLVAMIGWVYLGAKLGKYSNDWSIRIRDAKLATEKAIADHEKAELELSTARSELARLKLGWGFEWSLPAGGNSGSVQVIGSNLAVNGLGTDHGLQTREIEADGKKQIVAPTVHVFLPDGQGGSRYVGEFLADMQQLSGSSSVLVPTWAVTAEEIASWDFSQGVRMRSLAPAAHRAAIEGLNQALQRTRELYATAETNIANQKKLLSAAQEQLENRKRELLGNPDAPAVADRPEFRAGLVQALQDLEEDRNALQVRIDALRRDIKAAADDRESALQELNQLAGELPVPDAQLSRKSE